MFHCQVSSILCLRSPRLIISLVFIDLFRLASKTTDVNWRKEKDTAQLHSYYENRQFKWFNPRGIDYSNLSDKRGAPDYRN